MIAMCRSCEDICDTWNSDVDSEQPVIRIYRVPFSFRHVLRSFCKTLLRTIAKGEYPQYVCNRTRQAGVGVVSVITYVIR